MLYLITIRTPRGVVVAKAITNGVLINNNYDLLTILMTYLITLGNLKLRNIFKYLMILTSYIIILASYLIILLVIEDTHDSHDFC